MQAEGDGGFARRNLGGFLGLAKSDGPLGMRDRHAGDICVLNGLKKPGSIESINCSPGEIRMWRMIVMIACNRDLYFAGLLGVLLCPLLHAGCSPYGDYKWAPEIGRQIDPVAAGLEEYGTITMSSPIFTVPDETFVFGLNRDVNDYFKEAKSEIQGGASIFSQRSVDTQLGIKAQADIGQIMENLALLRGYRADLSAFDRKQALMDLAVSLNSFQPLLKVLDPSQLPQIELPEDGQAVPELSPPQTLIGALAEAATTAGTGLAGPTTRPAFPELGNDVPEIDKDVLPTAEERKAQNVFTDEKFTKFLGLLDEETSTTVSNRSAIISAAGDKTTEAIFRFMGNPKTAGSKVLFGVSMVAVNPGHRTYRGFSADVVVTTSVDYVPARPALVELLREEGDDTTKALIRAIEEANKLAASQLKTFRANQLKTIGKKGDPEDVEKIVRAERPSILLNQCKQCFQEDNHGPNKSSLLSARNFYGGSWEDARNWQKLQVERAKFNNGVNSTKGLMPPRPLKVVNEDIQKLKKKFKKWVNENGRGIAEVSAVSPMTETQTLDLKNSLRRQKSSAMKIAIALSGLGASAQGQFFRDFADRLEQDVATRSAINVVNSYSQSGSMFGFQVTPRLKALSDPSSSKARPVLTLDPLTFPMLIMVGIKAETARLTARILDDQLVLVEPMLVLSQTSRWNPQGNPIRDDLPLGRAWDRLWKYRLTEHERMEWAARLYAAEDEVRTRTQTQGSRDRFGIGEFMLSRIHMLREKVLGSFSQQFLPMDVFVSSGVPHVTPPIAPKSVKPALVKGPSGKAVPKKFKIHLTGRYLNRLVGDPAKYKVLKLDGSAAKGSAITGVDRVGKGPTAGVVLTFEPAVPARPTHMIFNLPFHEKGNIAYVLSPAIAVTVSPAKTPEVNLVTLEEVGTTGRMKLQLIGKNLDNIDHGKIHSIPNKASISSVALGNGRITFELTPNPGQSLYTFRLPFKKKIGGKDHIDTPPMIIAPRRTLQPGSKFIDREINKYGGNKRDRIEFSDGIDPKALNTFIRPATTQPVKNKLDLDVKIDVDAKEVKK